MIRGWCPTVHRPMPTGDGLLARVKPFGGRLSAAAALALAEAAGAYGNGVLELTGRGNIQVRGLHDPAAFARAMVAAGLADADPVREARRNVVTVPPCDDGLVAEVEALLAETAGLSEKACVVVRGGQLWVAGKLVVDLVALKQLLSSPLTQPSPASGRGLIAALPLPSFTGEGRGEGACRHFLQLPFGQTTAPELAHLATLTPELRTTPWRAWLSPVPVSGFPAEPTTILACAGAPACASATTATRADAARLQAMGFTGLHVSGCAKGCASPAPATTLVGRNGRYDLVRHGRAGDLPSLTGLTLDQAAAAL